MDPFSLVVLLPYIAVTLLFFLFCAFDPKG